MEKETRTLSLDRVTLRSDTGKFVGHAALFNKRTAIGDPKTWGFWEQVAPGAFDRALSENQDVRLLVDHDPSRLLGRTASGTLSLSVDRRGLKTEADLPDTSLGRDVSILLERGDLSQMSFGFMVKGQTSEELRDGTLLRTITDVDLFDVSVVTFPAYPDTDAAVRAAGLQDLRRSRWEAARVRLDALRTPGT